MWVQQMRLLLISVHYHCEGKLADCDELRAQTGLFKDFVYCMDDFLTQKPLYGGLCCHRVCVDLYQSGDQTSGLGAFTEATQHTGLDNNIRLSSFTTGTPILHLR